MMTKDELMRPLARLRGDAIVVTTMGAVRTWAQHSTSELDFASADSAMGHAADLALGIALVRPERKVICLNGDGSMLMSLGTLVTLVESGARNLVLFVLENRTFEITGNQPVPGAGKVDFATIARAAGIERVLRLTRAEDCSGVIADALAGEGPVVVVARVAPGNDGPLHRGPNQPAPYMKISLAESAHQMRAILAGR